MRSKKKTSQKKETQTPEIGLFTNFKNRGRACCAAIWNLVRFKQDTTNETENVMVSKGGMVPKRDVRKSHSHITAKALRSKSRKGFKRTKKKRCKTFRKVVKKPGEKLYSKNKKNSEALGLKSQRSPEKQSINFDEIVKAPKQQLNKKKKCLRKPKTKKPGKSLRKTVHKPGQKLSNKKKNSKESHMISKTSTSMIQKQCRKKKKNARKSNIYLEELVSHVQKRRVRPAKKISEATIHIPWTMIRNRKVNKTMRKTVKKPGDKCDTKKKISKQPRIKTKDILKRFNELLLESAAAQA